MNDDLPEASPKPDAKAEARADEAAAIRRRWITLGEVLTVIAVTISGLTLWNNWSERSDSEAAKTADATRASAQAATLVLMATGSGDELILKPTSADQSVQSQRISFPAALGVPAAETTGEPRIEAAWFDKALKKARDKAKLPDESRGDEKLPVVITTRFMANGKSHEDVALYDIGYSITGRWLGGHSITLRGVSHVSAADSRRAQAALDARWAALLHRERKAAP